MGKPIKSPADLVKYVRVTDQFGRRWGVPVEKETFAPAGPFEPLGWRAPWYPPAKYFRLDPDTPHLVKIDLAQLVADQKAAHQEYQAQLRRAGVAIHGHAHDPNAAPTKEVLDIIGTPPWPWEIAEAARRGDKWILGLSAEVNEALAKLLPSKRSTEDLEFDEELLGETLPLRGRAKPEGTPNAPAAGGGTRRPRPAAAGAAGG